MRAGQYPWSTSLIRTGRPTVGNLMGLCEENYGALMRLIPGLREIQGEVRSVLDQDMDLHLEILEQTAYTTLLRLTYFFPHDDGLVHKVRAPDPMRSCGSITTPGRSRSWICGRRHCRSTTTIGTPHWRLNGGSTCFFPSGWFFASCRDIGLARHRKHLSSRVRESVRPPCFELRIGELAGKPAN